MRVANSFQLKANGTTVRREGPTLTYVFAALFVVQFFLVY